MNGRPRLNLDFEVGFHKFVPHEPRPKPLPPTRLQPKKRSRRLMRLL